MSGTAVSAPCAVGRRIACVVNGLCKVAAVSSFSRVNCGKVARVSAACVVGCVREFLVVSF